MQDTEYTKKIADLCMAYRYESLPSDVIHMAKMSILDNLGCAVRGVKETLVQILGEELFNKKVVAADMIPGALRSAALPSVAMLHAASAHAIDYDDTFLPAQKAHAGSVVVGAALTLAAATGASGKDILVAVVAGYEVAARVGALLHSDHYLKGFHPTSTVGVFGAAAACARLLKLDAGQIRAALGLAATQACGLKCTFGTMAKPFNACNAAASGMLAARLAARGFSGPESALEADKGYLDMFIGLPEQERQLALCNDYRIRENLFKFHAACHATHPMIEAIKQLKEMHDFCGEDVESLHVTASSLSLKTASIGVPKSGMECKFSFSQVAAFVLAGLDTAANDTFNDDILHNQAVNLLREKVTINEDPAITPVKTTVTLVLKSTKTVKLSYDFDKNLSDIEMIGAKLESKFVSNVEPELGVEKAEALKDLVIALDRYEDGGGAFSKLL